MHLWRELLTAGWSKGPHKAKSEGGEAGEPIVGSELFLESRFLSCFASSSLLDSPFRARADGRRRRTMRCDGALHSQSE